MHPDFQFAIGDVVLRLPEAATIGPTVWPTGAQRDLPHAHYWHHIESGQLTWEQPPEVGF